MFVLTEAERIAILAGCIGLLCIVFLLTVCFVCPYCWFYQLITTRRSRKEAEMNLFRNHFPGVFLDHDPPPPYEASYKNSFFDLQSPLNFGRRLTPMNSISTISDTDSVTGIPLPFMSESEVPASEMRLTSNYSPGNVSLTVQFKRIFAGDKKMFSQLRVNMKEAENLPLRPYGDNCDPYFIIALYDKSICKKKKKKPSIPPIHEFHSTIAKKTQQPIYNESFFFPLEANQLKKTVLKIEAWDQDKWANDTLVGEAFFKLKDVLPGLLKEPTKELDVHLKMDEPKQTNGQIYVGLCYLPTAERVTVAVLKATNLQLLNDKHNHLGFYVQAMAIYEGRVIERRNTSRSPASAFPMFNEMLMFDIPFAKLDEIVILLTIRYNYSKGKDEVDDKQNLPKAKESFIGKVIIGSVGRKSSFNHWHAMRNSPRRQILQWHELR